MVDLAEREKTTAKEERSSERQAKRKLKIEFGDGELGKANIQIIKCRTNLLIR